MPFSHSQDVLESVFERYIILTMTTSPSSPTGLDFRNIVETPLRQFAPWLVMVLIVTWAGYPGVVCVTPMAWLIALRVGNICAAHSRSDVASRRLTEAALAGGILGFLQGILFAVIISQLEPINANEQTRTVVLTLIMIAVGMIAGAALSFFTAYLNEQRRRA
jgi:MFS family permease